MVRDLFWRFSRDHSKKTSDSSELNFIVSTSNLKTSRQNNQCSKHLRNTKPKVYKRFIEDNTIIR